MKLIHLSDLHLGKRVNEFSMLEDQEYILKEILDIVKEEAPDGVLVAGDIYDRAVPAEDAMRLWDGFLIALSEAKIPVFAISGNHDSAVRFADHGALLAKTGIYFSPVYDGTIRSCTLQDEYGPLTIYLLPYVKPAAVKSFFPDEEILDYTDACRVALQAAVPAPSERAVLLTHQFVTGAARCESEEIAVGGLDQVDASVFDAFDYVALGHLHGKQQIGRETLRYCGSPLKYSFSEKDQKKSITVVTLKEKGNVTVSERELLPLHDLRELRGSYTFLTDRRNYAGTDTEDYIHVVLTDEEDVVDAIGKLRTIYPNLMKLSYDNRRTRQQGVFAEEERRKELSPLALLTEFYERQNNQPMSEKQRALSELCIEDIWGTAR